MCNKCNSNTKYSGTRKTHCEFITDAIRVHGVRYNYSLVKYVNSYTKVWIGCYKHGFFPQKPSEHTVGKGCEKCAIEYNASRQRSPKRFIDFQTKANTKFNNKFDYSKANYVTNKVHIIIGCPIHGEFLQRPDNHLASIHGCEKCMLDYTQSKAVCDIEQSLHNINYIKEKRFDECRNVNPLPFDFYIEDLNLCIEYDGKQHYKPIKSWGGEEYLKRQQLHDSIKSKYCKDNGILLLRIKYTEDHVSVLKKYFKNKFNIDLEE